MKYKVILPLLAIGLAACNATPVKNDAEKSGIKPAQSQQQDLQTNPQNSINNAEEPLTITGKLADHPKIKGKQVKLVAIEAVDGFTTSEIIYESTLTAGTNYSLKLPPLDRSSEFGIIVYADMDNNGEFNPNKDLYTNQLRFVYMKGQPVNSIYTNYKQGWNRKAYAVGAVDYASSYNIDLEWEKKE